MPAIRNRHVRLKHLLSKSQVSLRDQKRKCDLHFLDSGAHSIYSREVIDLNHANGYNWYRSEEFVKYIDSYAAFVKKHRKGLDLYANVDAIFNPGLSWKTLKYLEQEHGLNPVPVIHYGTELRWIDKHLDAGYELLGIGGLGQEASKSAYLIWADRLFAHLCPKSNDYLPIVRCHGFAMVAHGLIIRYPWWSVDSASWAKMSAHGWLYLPYQRKGKFTFDKVPYVINISHRSPYQKTKGKHYFTMPPKEQKVVRDWLKVVDVPLGSIDENGDTKEYGVVSEYNARAIANLRFFDEVCKWLPKYPWPFKHRTKSGFIPWENIR